MENEFKNKHNRSDKYTQKDIEAFHLYSTDRVKLLRLIDEGYFSTLDSVLISQIIDKAHKDADAINVALRRKKKAQWDLMIANQQYHAELAKQAIEKKEAEDDEVKLANLKRLLGLS